MKNLIIQVPDMQSPHCQTRVKNAISNIDGVTINDIGPGLVEINLQDETRQNEVLNKISETGYTVAGVKSMHGLPDTGDTFTFKTNIHCSGCLSRVAKELNAAEGVCHWEVDLESKDKILSVHSESITPEEVIRAVQKAGFQIDLMNA